MNRPEEKENSGLQFFYRRQQWENPGQGSGERIQLSQRLPLPMTVELLDRYCAPYISGYGPDAQRIPSLTSLLELNPQTLGMGMHPESQEIVEQIYIFNRSEDHRGCVQPLPLRDCFEAGWWCVSFPIGAMVPMGHRLEHTAQMTALLTLLGQPTAIEPEGERFWDTLERGEGSIRYRLIYEQEDYVLVFRLTDTVTPDYALNFLSVDSCIYYPKVQNKDWKYEEMCNIME